MEENITLDVIRQTLIHLLKPLVMDVDQIPERGQRIKLRRMVTQLEAKQDSETPEMLARFMTTMLGEPSSPQSIQIPLKQDRDLYTTLLMSTKEITPEVEPSQSLVQSTMTTFTSSMGVHPQGGVNVSTPSQVMAGVPFAQVPMPFLFPTEKRYESIWLRAPDGSSYSGQIDLGSANYLVKKHLMTWDPQRSTWKATHIWSEGLNEEQHQTYIHAFQNLCQTIPQDKWNIKQAFQTNSNRYTGSKKEWNRNGPRRYSPY